MIFVYFSHGIKSPTRIKGEMADELDNKQKNILFGGIASLREAKGWRQGYLAEKAGVSQSLISRIERGKGGTPSYEHLVKIAEALDTSIDELMTGEIKEASASISLSSNKSADSPKKQDLKADPIVFQQSQNITHYSQHYPLPPFEGAILYDHMQAGLLEAPPILRKRKMAMQLAYQQMSYARATSVVTRTSQSKFATNL